MVASSYTQSVEFDCISLFLDIWHLSDYNFKWDMDLGVQLVRAVITSDEKT